jgi:hypothetical protein
MQLNSLKLFKNARTLKNEQLYCGINAKVYNSNKTSWLMWLPLLFETSVLFKLQRGPLNASKEQENTPYSKKRTITTWRNWMSSRLK